MLAAQRSASLALNIFQKLCTYIACLSIPSPHASRALECTRIPRACHRTLMLDAGGLSKSWCPKAARNRAHGVRTVYIAALPAPTSTCVRPATLARTDARSAKMALPRRAETSTQRRSEPGNSHDRTRYADADIHTRAASLSPGHVARRVFQQRSLTDRVAAKFMA